MATMRSTWGPHDVKALVRAVGSSPQLPALMSSTTAPNAAAWQGVIAAMGACGRGRTTAQVRAKWKSVKAAFHHERAHRLSTGQPSSERLPHYRRLLRLWVRAGRPAFRDRRYTPAMTGAQRREAAERPRRRQPLQVEEEEEEEVLLHHEEEAVGMAEEEVDEDSGEAVEVQEQQQQQHEAVESQEQQPPSIEEVVVVEEGEEQEERQLQEEEVVLQSSPDSVAEQLYGVARAVVTPGPQDGAETMDRQVQTSPMAVPVHTMSVATNTEPQEVHGAAALEEEVIELRGQVAAQAQLLEARDLQLRVRERVLERHENHIQLLHQETMNLHVAIQGHLATIRWLQGVLDETMSPQ